MNPIEIYNKWLADPQIDEETKAELRAIDGDEAEITDRFYQELEFGTAGLRGVIGAGTNRMNKYTVAKATQGLADYINSREAANKQVVIAYDSRHKSAEFSDITAAVLNANGIRAFVFDGIRPTPELSFAVRELDCIAGVNITASHNPAQYNGYKAYWSDGAQVTPPHDRGIMDCVNKVENLSSPKMMAKDDAVAAGLYITIGRELDEKYISVIRAEIREPQTILSAARDFKIVYTPLHGAGIAIVPEALETAGFENIFVVPSQAEPDGDFPTVPYPNPETDRAFVLGEKLGYEVGADVVIATDPDADRIGIRMMGNDGEYHRLSGNMIGAFLCDYELGRMREAGAIPKDGFVVRSIVSSRMTDAIAAEYGVSLRTTLTGFKYIGKTILDAEESGRGTYLFGYEESYGFLTGTYARDKDACGTALALCEACAYYKTKGTAPWDAMLALYEKYGHFAEKTISITKEGIDGMKEIGDTMESLRTNPPSAFGKYKVLNCIDYKNSESTGLPASNVLEFDLEEGWVAVRPSGTEPKIKYYIGVKGSSASGAEEMIKEIEAAL